MLAFAALMNALTESQAIQKITQDAPHDARFLFDCDGTLIRGDINNACFRALLPLGLIDDHILPSDWQRRSLYALGDLDYKNLESLLIKEHGLRGYFEWEIKSFRGLPRKTVRETSYKILSGPSESNHIETHTSAWNLAAAVSDRAWIVSGSERSCIEAVADLLKIDRKRVVASELQEVDGLMGSALEEPGINWEENKVKSLKLRGVESAYLCAGDSTGDWELLQLAQQWRWCVVEIGESVPDYKRVFRDRILDDLKISASSLDLGLFACENSTGPHTLLQVVNHHK